jgi:beta-mannanase
MYYPGDDYVDIVALDVYLDDPVILPFCSNI